MTYLWLGWYIAILITGLSLTGLWVDKKLQTTPLFLLIGMLIAMIAIALEIRRHWNQFKQ